MSKRVATISKIVCIICLLIFIISSIVLCSYESKLNVASQNVQDDIDELENEVEGLNVQIQKSSSFSKMEEIAEKNGYTYQPNTSTTAAVTTEE